MHAMPSRPNIMESSYHLEEPNEEQKAKSTVEAPLDYSFLKHIRALCHQGPVKIQVTHGFQAVE
jgi:hypothetical protein